MSHLIVVGAPRNGAGAVQELLLLDEKFSSSELSSRDFVQGLAIGENEFENLVHIRASAQESPQVVADYSPHFATLLPKLESALPEAKFVVVVRKPIDAIQSLLVAWESKKFEYWEQPEGWWGLPWSFGLVPNADQLIGKPIPEVVSEQYLRLSESVSMFAKGLDQSRVEFVAFEDLLANPQKVLSKLADFASSTFEAQLPDPLPRSSRSISRGRLPKTAALRVEIEVALRDRQALLGQVRSNWLAKCAVASEVEAPKPSPEETKKTVPSQGTPFSSVFTDSFVSLLSQLGATLAISTYKSGHVIFASELEGKINTTFQRFDRPMGLASSGTKLAIGTLDSIRSYNNQPGLSAVVTPKDFFDAVYAPRNTVYTGDIAIHEIAYGLDGQNDELWFVNTSFSCLCKQDLNYSFVPVWQPEWITGLANEDRCHLNGLAMVDSIPKYVTALSETDSAFGWREGKGSSGVIIDVTTNRVITRGLAMPHSPRWHEGQLWVLESGKGSLAKVNIETGEVETVAILPGFTRGLVFAGVYALVGLSQVRESVFKDLPVTESKTERNCGVWIVDTRTGTLAGKLKFDGVVTEIFDITLLFNSKNATVVESSPTTLNSYTLPQDALNKIVQKGPIT